MIQKLCLRYHRHCILNMTECEPFHAIRDMFKELFTIYEKMNWVQHRELQRMLAEAVPRFILVLILAECLQDRNCHQEQSSYILLGE